MAGDFGDESGQRLLDDFVRFGEQMGVEAMRERAYAVRRACDHARAGALAEAGRGEVPWAEPREWARLDMGEFQGIEGYGRIKEIIGSKLAGRGVDVQWYAEESLGKEFMLFRVRDAREVWEGFGELSREAGDACEKAAEAVRAASERDQERGRGRAARGGAMESPPAGVDAGREAHDRGSAARRLEPGEGRDAAVDGRGDGYAAGARGARAGRGAHARGSAVRRGAEAVRGMLPWDARPLEERAAHARAASAALSGEGAATRGRGARMQEVVSR